MTTILKRWPIPLMLLARLNVAVLLTAIRRRLLMAIRRRLLMAKPQRPLTRPMLYSMDGHSGYSTIGKSLSIYPRPIYNFHFTNRAACERSVIRFSGQRYKGYYSVQEAKDAWDHANAVGNVGPITAATVAGPSTDTKFNHVLSDEEAYWALLQGQYPGVYHGL